MSVPSPLPASPCGSRWERVMCHHPNAALAGFASTRTSHAIVFLHFLLNCSKIIACLRLCLLQISQINHTDLQVHEIT
jgi:hypothetical protein